MEPTEQIWRLIESQAISEEEGARLLAALEKARTRDRVVEAELARIRRARRRGRAWGVVSVSLFVLAAILLLWTAVLGPGSRPDVAYGPESAERLLGPDLDAAIAGFEADLRQPGSADRYRLLSRAYGMRYERSGDPADRERAAQAAARAERIERRSPMRGATGVFGLVSILVVVAIVALAVMLMYNSLATRDERVEERWAQVEAQLQRRLDLVPQLVETVRGYAEHERETLVGVTQARARAMGALEATGGTAPRGPEAAQAVDEAQAELGEAIGRLLAVAEQYPDLKASANYVTLQDQLEGTENRIAVERQRYNDAVRVFNSRLRTFPTNVVGGMFSFEPREYFQSRLGAEEPVQVEL